MKTDLRARPVRRVVVGKVAVAAKLAGSHVAASGHAGDAVVSAVGAKVDWTTDAS